MESSIGIIHERLIKYAVNRILLIIQNSVIKKLTLTIFEDLISCSSIFINNLKHFSFKGFAYFAPATNKDVRILTHNFPFFSMRIQYILRTMRFHYNETRIYAVEKVKILCQYNLHKFWVLNCLVL